jgi:hypothetical protein
MDMLFKSENFLTAISLLKGPFMIGLQEINSFHGVGDNSFSRFMCLNVCIKIEKLESFMPVRRKYQIEV